LKVIILAGGYGSRLSEETNLKPKPLLEIGEKPIIWHIMKLYSHYGFNDFVICLGYKGYLIKQYFQNFLLHQNDIQINLKENKLSIIGKNISEPWNIQLIDTGLNSQTGLRIKKSLKYVQDDTFMLTYGDGVADINIKKLLKHHKLSKKLATITAVKPPGRFGALVTNKKIVSSFEEKPSGDGQLINGGFFVLNKQIENYIQKGNIVWEKQPLENLAKNKELSFFHHTGFWQPMDTLRDKNLLNDLWDSNKAKWKVWK